MLDVRKVADKIIQRQFNDDILVMFLEQHFRRALRNDLADIHDRDLVA